MATPPLPPGFVLETDQPTNGAISQTNGIPPLPPGFELEADEPSLEIDIVGGTPAPVSQVEAELSDPTEGMGQYQRYLAGLGRSMVSGYEGVKQLGTAVIGELAGDRTGLTDGDNAVTRWAGRTLAELQADEAKRRKLDAPLMDTAAGRFGDAVGTVAQLVGPGVALRGTTAASAFLPATLRGNAAQGAVFGLAQPVADESERAPNALMGTALSAAGVALPRYAIAAGQGLRNALPAVTQAGQSRQAANVLTQFAADPNALRNINPEQIVPGSIPTLAEATGDVGLAGLQRTLANMPEFGNQLATRTSANNAARVAEIERAFNGADPIAADAARSTRDVMAKRVLNPARELPMQGLDRVQTGVTNIAKRHQAAPAVREAMAAVAAELPNIKTVGDAHAVRQYIGQLVGGQVEGKAGSKLAKRELMAVQSLLDREMKKVFPEWGTFLRDYKAISREADQIDVGATLLDTGRAIRGATNEPVLTPAAFARAAGNLDRTVQRSTGFKRATAARTLTAEQTAAVDTVRRDLERYARATTDGKAIGSNTVQNAIGGNTFQSAVGPVGAAVVEPVSGVAMLALNQLRSKYSQKVAEIVQDAMLNPDRAAEILATLPPGQRSQIVKSVAGLIPRVGGTAGVVAPALAE